MRMGCKLSPQSHFTCLFHDHAKCSCIGGPRHLVQSHFTCHSHEMSSSLFFVPVYPTHTCFRVSCFVPCFLFFSFCCSSVSVSTDITRRNVFLTYKAISRLRALVDFTLDRTTDLSEFSNTPVISDCHVGILALLVVFCFLAARARTPHFQRVIIP